MDFALVIFHARIVSKRAAVDRAALQVVHQCGFPKGALVDRVVVINRRVIYSTAIVDLAALPVGHRFFQRGVGDLAPVLNYGGELAVADLAALLVVRAPTSRADIAVGNLAVVMQSIRITQRNPAVRGAFYGAVVGQITAGQRLDAAQRSTFFNNHGVATGKRRQRIRVVRLRSVVIPDDRQCFGARIIRPDLIGRQLVGRADGEFRHGGEILQLHRVAHGPGLAAAAEQVKAELERAVILGVKELLTYRPFGAQDIQTVGSIKALATRQSKGQLIAHLVHTLRAGLCDGAIPRQDGDVHGVAPDDLIVAHAEDAGVQLKASGEGRIARLHREGDGIRIPGLRTSRVYIVRITTATVGEGHVDAIGHVRRGDGEGIADMQRVARTDIGQAERGRIHAHECAATVKTSGRFTRRNRNVGAVFLASVPHVPDFAFAGDISCGRIQPVDEVLAVRELHGLGDPVDMGHEAQGSAIGIL